MTPESVQVRNADPRSRGGDHWQGVGFGLLLRSPYPVIGLARRKGDVVPDATRLLLGEGPAPEALVEGKRLREFRYDDGRVAMAIDDLGEAGLRIVAEEFGAHEIACDGRTIRSRPAEGLPAWRWQRLLTGQVLPLAAALRGLELLHASAVAVGGVAFALAGDSGVGKSSLAAHLILRGAALLTDDVLAISLDASGRPQAHSGSTAFAFRREDSDLAARLTRSGMASVTGSDDKDHVLVSAAARSMSLGAVYLLNRSTGVGQTIGEPRDPTLSDLMSCSYVRYLGAQARLTAQLSVQAAIARNCSIVPVNVGSGISPQQLAVELQAHMTNIARELSQS